MGCARILRRLLSHKFNRSNHLIRGDVHPLLGISIYSQMEAGIAGVARHSLPRHRMIRKRAWGLGAEISTCHRTHVSRTTGRIGTPHIIGYLKTKAAEADITLRQTGVADLK